MHLVLIETSANQDFIFGTNKLRENVGASELVFRIGEWANQAAQAVPRGSSPQPVEPIIATSGKALIPVPDPEIGRQIIRHVTLQALEQAAGLEVLGVVGEPFDWQADPLHDAVKKVHQQHQRFRNAGAIPGPATRFLRLPVVAPCATSGLPAKLLDRDAYQRDAPTDASGHPPDAGAYLRSAVAQAKRQAADEGWKRLREKAGSTPLPASLEEIERELESLQWLAVIHADGNGVGQVLMKFNERVPGSNEEYGRALHDFSGELDRCGGGAFQAAAEAAWQYWQGRDVEQGKRPDFLPLLPLVLGGDDLTVVCDGRLAIPFVEAYLREFEQRTAEGIIGRLLATSAGNSPARLSACAGVAIVKPHFPFYAAYQLAEKLLQSAKQVKRFVVDGRGRRLPCSAFDYQVLYDASGADLKRLRDQWTLDEGKTVLSRRPYLVTPLAELAAAEGDARIWAQVRHVDYLKACLKTVRRQENGRRRLPNSLLHELREALFDGRQIADARLELALARHRAKDFDPLLESKDDGRRSLFRTVGGVACTALLDAMDLIELWDVEDDDD